MLLDAISLLHFWHFSHFLTLARHKTHRHRLTLSKEEESLYQIANRILKIWESRRGIREFWDWILIRHSESSERPTFQQMPLISMISWHLTPLYSSIWWSWQAWTVESKDEMCCTKFNQSFLKRKSALHLSNVFIVHHQSTIWYKIECT